MAKRTYIAVDLGAESGRTILATFDGRRFDLVETHRFANGPVRILGTMFWDVVRLWQEIKNGLIASIQKAGGECTVGVDTWGVDFGLVDAAGQLVGNPVHYRDHRTDGMQERTFGIVSREDIYLRTGLQFLPFNTLFQLMALKRVGAGAGFASAKRMLLVPDLFNSFLTGEQVAEFTIASTTQMMNAVTRHWDHDLMERLELPIEILPEIVPTGTSLGPVLPDVAKELGGPLKVIATAGHDTAAAVAAVPAKGEDWCYISSGTWSLMGSELANAVISEKTLEDNFTNEGGVGQSVRFLKNIMGLWLVQECRRSFERSGSPIGYAELTAKAAAASAPAVLNPDHPSFLNPVDMPTALRAYCRETGQPEPDDQGSLIRTCLEGLALRYRWTMERLKSHTGQSINRIHIVGGGTQNRLLSQLTADAAGVEVLAGPVEATALGNVLVQAMSQGDIDSLAEGRDAIRESFPLETFHPNEADRSHWDERYERFLKLIK